MAARQIYFEAAHSAVGALVKVGVLLVVAIIISALGGLLVGATAPFVGPANALGIWLVVGVLVGIKLIRS